MLALPYLHWTPKIAERLRAEASAAVIGRAEIGPDCSLGRLAAVRADGEAARLGADCWFGEASTVHIADGLYPSIVGAHVTVGRYGLVHACTIGDDCVIGEHAAVMDGSKVGPGAVIAAESVVPPGKTLAGGWLYAGAPARPVAPVSAALIAQLHRAIRGDGGNEAPPGGGAPGSGTLPGVIATAPLPDLRHAPGTGTRQSFAAGAYVAPTASLAGRVLLAERASVWFGTEIDAGEAVVEIGEESNVQDNSRLYGGKAGQDIRIGARVLIGHNVRIFASAIGDRAIIGMGAVIAPGTVVQAGGCVAAGSVTEPGTVVGSGQIWSGRPAHMARALSDANREAFARGVQAYVAYAGHYLAGAAR